MNQRVWIIATTILLALGLLAVSLALAQDAGEGPPGSEAQREMAETLAAERNAQSGREAAAFYYQIVGPSVVTAPLFAGVNLTAVPAYLIDPASGSQHPQFTGGVIWGAAYDAEHGRILLSSGSTLHEWLLSGTPSALGNFTGGSSEEVLAIAGLAYHGGTLYGSRTVASAEDPEGIYTIDPLTLQATLLLTYSIGAANVDMGGIDADPNSGTLYGTNDGPGEQGLVEIGLDGALTLLAPYPEGEDDIDGLAISDDGRAFLIPDAPGDIYVFDFNTLTYTAPISNPWSSSALFSGGAWLTNGSVEGPAIELSKTVGTDANNCATADELIITTTTNVTYCFEATNTGSVTLTLHNLIDTELGPLHTELSRTLPPGSSTIVTETVPVSATTFNTAIWTAYNPGPADVVSATAAALVVLAPEDGPAIHLRKTVGTNRSECAQQEEITVEPHAEVTYCYEVRNTGDTALALHDVEDSEIGPIVSSFPHNLQPGATFQITQSLVVTTNVTNTATWTAYNAGPADVVSATAVATVTIGPDFAPEVTIAPAVLAPTVKQGTQASIGVVISNTGTADLQWSISEAAADCATPVAIPWLAVSSAMGVTAPNSAIPISASFDAGELDEGEYSALLCFATNDMDESLVPVTVTLTVIGNRINMPAVLGSPVGNP